MQYELYVYGKEYSLETKLLLNYLESYELNYEYIDLEFEENEFVLDRFKSMKFRSIPVLEAVIFGDINKRLYVVGYKINSINKIIKLIK